MKFFSRLLLPISLTTGLGAVYFLPSVGKIADSAVAMELPLSMGGWEFRTRAPSEEEVATLEKGTRFSKAECLRARPGEYTWDGQPLPDWIDLSIVLSGTDLNNSIHRPERCMPAQGHFIRSSSDFFLELGDGRVIPVRRLQSDRSLRDKEQNAAGSIQSLTYYFFVGHDKVTNDHFQRTFIDMKDRLLRGMDQRWAYVSITTYFGELPVRGFEGKWISEEEADERLKEFTKEFAIRQIDWKALKKN